MWKCPCCNEIIGDKAVIHKAGRDVCPKCGSIFIEYIQTECSIQDVKAFYDDGIDRGV